MPRELARLRIDIAAAPDTSMEDAVRELQRTRAQVRRLWPLPPRLPAEADVLVCAWENGLADRLPWIVGQPAAALVVVLPQGREADYRRLRDTAPHAVAARPLAPGALTAAVVTGHGAYRYEQRLQQRIGRLEETLKALRTIERAKAMLMQERRMTEEAAWQHLRAAAMRLRVPVPEVAASLVDSALIMK